MKKVILSLLVLSALLSCNNEQEKKVIETEATLENPDNLTLEEQAESLKKEGYQVFTYQEGETTYLMQQYYMAFLKSGENRGQDSTETAKLQEQHLAHLERMAVEGYASLIGPFGDDGEKPIVLPT